MKTSQALKLAGGTYQALADVFGLSRQAASQWGDTLPPLRVYQLRELRPEWFKKARNGKSR